MTEHTRCINIDAEAWERELLAVIRDILDAEPVAAMNRINQLLDMLDDHGSSQSPRATKFH